MLRDTQQKLLDSLLHRRPGAEVLVEPGAFSAKQHLQIHQNNIYVSLTEALSAIYPVVARLVGEDFFRASCREFIPGHAPKAAALLQFGKEFPDFLARFEPSSSLVYLPDVARLEWAWHESFHAGDAPPFDSSVLLDLAGPEQDRLKFALHPAARLARSDYPVYRIWQTNQPDFQGAGEIDLDQGPEQVLLVRPELAVLVLPLEPAEWALLDGLNGGETLEAAYAAAAAIDPELNLAECLQRRVADTTLVRAWL